MRTQLLSIALMLVAASTVHADGKPPEPAAATAITLPGTAPIGMDYLAYDSAQHRVWVPAGNSGKVDVIDTATGKLTAIDGFATLPSTRPGRPNMGPSSASVGDGVVWVGNRGDNKVCAFDARSLEKRACAQLAGMPDGVQYVAATHELWVTTPRDQTITIVDVKGKLPGTPATIKLEGDPEGYALDGARGLFYTNLEDKDKTLTIDLKTRKVTATWPAGCGADGPRGLVLDSARKLLLVACSDGANALDLAHDGKIVGHLKTGKGVDNLDYNAARKLLYIASSQDALLTIASVADNGALAAVTTVKTSKGARNPVLDSAGTAYVSDSANGKVLVIPAPAK
jgi:DNA-binding beta-propeller fold protein YncE